jgi:1,3-beta-glucanosyltransferase GAS3
MIIDVNSPLSGESLDRSNPSGTYNKGYMNRVFSVIEAFKDYKNVLGFFAGNEIINDDPTAGPNPPYIRVLSPTTGLV